MACNTFTRVRESIQKRSITSFEAQASYSQGSMKKELSVSEQDIGPAHKNPRATSLPTTACPSMVDLRRKGCC